MLNIFDHIFLFITLFYALFILFFFMGLFFPNRNRQHKQYHVSVVIAARNEEHNITPQQIIKASSNILREVRNITGQENAYVEPEKTDIAADPVVQYMNKEAILKAIENTKAKMEKAASELDFIQAAKYRDEMQALQELLDKKI